MQTCFWSVMKKLATAIAAIALIGTPAFAADMAVKAPSPPAPPPAPVCIWCGFYLGGQIGYAWSNSSYTHFNGAINENFTFNPTSAIGGPHVGIQGQWDSWVFGLEGTFNWADLNQADPSVLLPNRVRSLRTDEIETIVGKAGYAWDRWLLYAKGGWANSRISVFAINTASGVNSQSTAWQGGWTVGGGLDYMMAPNWIAGIDFNYYKFEKFDRSPIDSAGVGVSYFNTNSNIYAVTARLSYLFNWSPYRH
jgi:outer membrane immunogenic protein